MTTILQITDTHIVRPERLVSGQLDTAASLRKLVSRIKQIKPQLGSIDAVLVTGDLTDDGAPESYAHFKSLMAPLQLPLFVIPGNHDRRAPMRAAFAEHSYLPRSGKLNWQIQLGDIDVIGLDTLIESQGGGEIDETTLVFLEQALIKGQSRPTLLALHHPPFDSGIAFMDALGLQAHKPLAKLLQGFNADIRIICGHIHSTMIATIGGKTALSSPSPSSCFAYDTTPDAPVGFMDQEDGFMLHNWQNGFRSIRIPIEAGLGPNPF
ncbi:3',5'-cyclic adenosine monophosphate phosphodiesterase CpdA (plasmid) [Pseudoseohaeicola sp. NH-UV-7]|uniref:phosphodiesterase n=1 Tax=unclassified Sulfitobacter TaxID=196795 RepID=UPI000E0CAB07|nr:phosphodiesterase [Sulfitobacter sp. JL08]AXI53358.1 phosphodiesterase [Sulfitobacter sp. JL08]